MSEAKIRLSAENKTRAAFADVKRDLLGLRDSAQQINVAFGATAAVLGSAFAGLSLTGFIRSTAAGVDALNDVKDATGASIENISALEDVALRTGATLDTVTSTLVKFNSVLATPERESIFRALGLDVAELKRLDPAEALRQTAVALARFADDGDKARVVQELFGKSIREAAPFLNDLAAAGELNARVTGQQAEEAERFNRNLSELVATSTQLARTLVGPVVSAINELTTRWRTAQATFGGPGGAVAAGVFGRLNVSDPLKGLEQYNQELAKVDEKIRQITERPRTRGFGPLLDEQQLQELRKQRGELQKFADYYSSLLQGDPRNDPRIGRGFGSEERPQLVVPEIRPTRRTGAGASTSTRPDTGFVGPQVPEGLEAAQRLIAATDVAKLAGLREQLEALTRITAAGTDRPEVFRAIENVVAQINELDPAYQAAVRQQARLNELLEQTPTARLERTRADMQLLVQAYEEGRLGLVGSQEAVQAYSEAVHAALGTTAETVKQTSTDLDEFARQAAGNIQNALGDTLKRTLRGDFDSIGQLWGNLLLDMAAQAAAAQLGKLLLGDFGATGSIGGLLGQGLGFLFGVGRAHGGPVGARSVQPVNEFGPEVFTDYTGRDWLMTGARGGMVTPAGPAAAAGSAGGMPAVHITNHVSGGMGRNEVFQAIALASQRTEASIVRLLRNQKVLA